MINLKNINKKFGDFEVIKNISCTFNQYKIITIVGPSGCGKSTLLNILSGLILPTKGEIENLDNFEVGYMFQDDLLLPWRTLKENLTLGLEILKKENESNYYEYLESFGLHGYENYYPDKLSGGMKQRAALIRTLLPKPNILLLDEPFSNLDFDIKIRIQREILKFQKENETTIILVTHDLEDAIALSDEIIILSDKPTSIKKQIKIEHGFQDKNPIEIRKSYKFTDYFAQICNELKYLTY